MKKILVSCSMLIICCLFAGCSKVSADSSLKDIKSKGEFVVGLDDSFPPMGFKSAKGEIVGFDIDLANEAAKRMGLKAVFKPVDWDGVILSLKNKDIDLIWNGLTITKERSAQIAFSKVYLKNRQIIMVKQDSKISKKSDLAGKVIGLQMGSSSENALKSDAVTAKSIKELKKYSNNTEALMDLSAGRLSAVVIDEVVGRYYMEKKRNLFKVLNDNFGFEDYGVGMRKDDVSFLKELNKVLDEMKADGTAAKISKKWFVSDIVEK